jgi:hypothetical protein
MLAAQVDPLLGWGIPPSPNNPLGIVRDGPYTPRYSGKTILFYGDSLVQGVTTAAESLPHQLEQVIPDYAVYNYGIGGYGLDQAYLRYRESHRKFETPIVIFGIYSEDIDRCVLSVRSGQKPYFRIENGVLTLKGVPIDPDPQAWLAANPPRVASYLLAFIQKRLRILAAHGRTGEVSHRKDEGKEIASRLIQTVVQESTSRNEPLLFVVFYAPGELTEESWRERFLLDEIAATSVPVVDTKPLLLQAARDRGVQVAEFYKGAKEHPNVAANRIMAEAIARALPAGGRSFEDSVPSAPRRTER